MNDPRPAWMDHGACVGVNPDLFFPTLGDHGTALEAKRICAVCTVRQQCLDYAIANGEQHGIWGGVNLKKRRELKRSAA